jgi:hypothetical protein
VLLAQAHIAAQRVDRGLVQEDHALVAELGPTHQQPPITEVDVGRVESEAFPEAQAGDRKQPDQRLVGHCPPRRGQFCGRSHEGGDVGRGVQIRRHPASAAAQQALGGDLGGRVDALEMSGEAPHDSQALTPPGGGGVDRQHGPRQRELSGDVLGAGGGEVGDEVGQQDAVTGQGETEPAADSEIVLHRGVEIYHRAPGHGWASGRSAAESTRA